MSILANALATTSWVDSVPMIDAMLTAAAPVALLTVPSSDLIEITFRTAPTDQGRS